MARRTSFKLPGLTTWVENIKNKVSQEAAEKIVDDLKQIGPYWSGDFESAWVVKPGKTRISANRQPSDERPSTPRARQITQVNVPPAQGRKSVDYTIGNEMVYRNIAMDLDPGRVRWKGGEPPNTAPQDWYRTYVEGGNLRLTLEQATARAAKDPKIRGFKS
jgi:hypothetical protein